ncbi:hypothetical protein [Bradyrhizobium sp. LVM 105]|uniref:hypothetical protein n=1 Tax=Bradyrhizobium sp. LVM 105 TaxID=2341115 RepID=UPI000F7FEE04|nr:hypothetical protein [Bradyrhizobium sp. LVM 105]RTE88765.1 hypothetical protein D6B98_33365 [Bradyrhizobium sp. LVM 105]
MSRKHCIRAAIGRRLTRAASSVERVTIIQHCSEPWRAMTAQLISVVSVFLGSPMTFATIPLLIEGEGGSAVQ